MEFETGNCFFCGCHWTIHENSKMVYRQVEFDEVVEIDYLKQQYDQGKAQLSNSNTLLYELYDRKDLIINDLEARCKKIRICAKYLQENALRPQPYDSVDHFTEMKLNLEQKQPAGW